MPNDSKRRGIHTVDGFEGSRSGLWLAPKWYSVVEVADLLGYGLSKTKLLIATGQIRSLKDGGIGEFCRSGSMSTSPGASLRRRHDRP